MANLTIHFTSQAKADLGDIASYTLLRWGLQQVEQYMALFDAAFARLQQHPDIGMKRSEISSHHRSLVVGKHTIFYSTTSTEVCIARILHQHVDVYKEKVLVE